MVQTTGFDDFIERVNERSDIYSVVSRYVPLTQKSGRYWGRCPFHNEKTASFSVSPDKGLFYCFGCGAGGNVFKFLSLIENITYFEAVKLQAERLGIDIPTKKSSPEQERRRREEKILLKINELAQDFYHECLIKTARGEIGRKYLASRGITAETIETFHLGFAPDEWENLFNRFIRQDFTPQQLESVGLIAKRKNSSGYYDRFRGRIMIPIADINSHVVGFGGRILKADDSTPKYLNTPETALFNKRNLLFGLDKSNREINAANTAIVVEGYMDAISLFSAGIKNVVATLGTAFTPEHAKLIMRYARKIIFCYDSDEAGQRATIRALPIVQATGAEVFVVKVPDGKDPDEFVRKHGKNAFLQLIKNAQTLIRYRMDYVLARAEMSTINGKIRALREILPVVANVNDVVTRNEYTKEIATAMLLDEQLVIDEWEIFLRDNRQQTSHELEKNSAVKRARLPQDDETMIRNACDSVVRMLWYENDLVGYVKATTPEEIFSPAYKEIIDWLENCAKQGKRPNDITAAKDLSEDANSQLSRLLIGGSNDPRATELKVFEDSLKILKRAGLQKKYEKVLMQAQEYKPSDGEPYVKAVQESLKLKREIDSLKGN